MSPTHRTSGKNQDPPFPSSWADCYLSLLIFADSATMHTCFCRNSCFVVCEHCSGDTSSFRGPLLTSPQQLSVFFVAKLVQTLFSHCKTENTQFAHVRWNKVMEHKWCTKIQRLLAHFRNDHIHRSYPWLSLCFEGNYTRRRISKPKYGQILFTFQTGFRNFKEHRRVAQIHVNLNNIRIPSHYQGNDSFHGHSDLVVSLINCSH